MAVGSLNNAFLFVVFIIFNKVYHDLFFKYMRCKNNKVASIETLRMKKPKEIQQPWTLTTVL
jgi:hypothetical protein